MVTSTMGDRTSSLLWILYKDRFGMLEVPRDHPSEGEHVDAAGAGRDEGMDEGPHGGAGGIDIVDDENGTAAGQPPPGSRHGEGAAHIGGALAKSQPDLLAGVPVTPDAARRIPLARARGNQAGEL